MITAEFNPGDISSADFHAALTNGERFFVPIDVGVRNALKAILRETVDAFESLESDWEAHDISEDYGERRRIYALRANPLFQSLSDIFDSGALAELPDLQNHLADLDYYFAKFVDHTGRIIVGVKKARNAKATLYQPPEALTPAGIPKGRET